MQKNYLIINDLNMKKFILLTPFRLGFLLSVLLNFIYE